MGVLALKLLDDFEGAVLRPIVDHDNLVVGESCREYLRGLLNDGPDIRLFVVGG